MIKRSTLAMALAIAAPLAIVTAEETVAAPVLPGASALKASSASAIMDVQYVYDFGPYAYRPVYKYKGYPIGTPGFGAGNTPGTTTIGEREFVAALFWRRPYGARFSTPFTTSRSCFQHRTTFPLGDRRGNRTAS